MPLRVLIVCYYFPPTGGAGVGRPLSLYKYLPDEGVEPHILTVSSIAYNIHEPELLAGVDQSRVHRSGSYDPQRLLRLVGVKRVGGGAIRKTWGVTRRMFPDSQRGWIGPAVRMGKRLAQRYPFDLIMSTSPPMSCHLIARRLSHETGLPWVADFRDFWTLYPLEEWFEDRCLRERGRRLLDRIADEAAVLVANNRAVAKYVGAEKVVLNSFDPDRCAWQLPSTDTPFRIGVLGTIDEARPIEPLLEVVSRVRGERPDLLGSGSIVQVGRCDRPDIESSLASRGLAGWIEWHGLQRRPRTVELLSECSLLYISAAEGWAEGVIPGRAFDLMASGRPLLVAAPPNAELARLLEATPDVCTYQPDDASLDTAVSFVVDVAARHSADTLVVESPPPYAEPYSAPAMAARFAEIFRTVVEG